MTAALLAAAVVVCAAGLVTVTRRHDARPDVPGPFSAAMHLEGLLLGGMIGCALGALASLVFGGGT